MDEANLDAATHAGRPLDRVTRNWFEPRFGRDLSNVRLHDDGHAASLSRAVGARAFARGPDVYVGRRLDARVTDQDRWLLAHEIAHTLQPGDSEAISRKALSDLPEATRKKLKISRTAPAESAINVWIKNYFNPKSGVSRQSTIVPEFGADITDANHQIGLRSIAFELAALSEVNVTPATATTPASRTNTDPEAWPLPADAILELALDLRQQGGEHAIFRFTRYTNGTTDTVLIEKTRVLAAAPVATPAAPPATTAAPPAKTAPAAPSATTAAPPAKTAPAAPSARSAAPPAKTAAPAKAAAPSFTGEIQVGNVKVTIDSSFGDDRGKAIADAVRLLPEPIRAKVDGVRFNRVGSGKGPNGQNGEYREDTDTVNIWDELFDASARRVGEASAPAYQIVHELGHAVDRRPLFKAQRDRTNAEQRRRALQTELSRAETKFVDPNDPLGGIDTNKDPRVVAEKTRIQGEITKVTNEITALDTAVAGAKSIAGDETGGDTESLLTEFGKAIAGDGVKAVPDARKRNRVVDAANTAAAKANAAAPSGPQTPMKQHEKTLAGGVSNYARTDLMEAFAENFAYYLLDEVTFREIRPKTYAYFVRAFPKAPAPKP
jgi:hypothetical protein